MLYAFGFGQVAVVVGDISFIDPNPGADQEGPEQGVRPELRALERGDPEGSIQSARPVSIDRPIWRADPLESVDDPGSSDRTHHPQFRGWEPGSRDFVPELSADPLPWVGARLSDLEGLIEEAGLKGEVEATDDGELRKSVPEILAAVQRTLDRIRAGELGQPPEEGERVSARASWL